MSLTTSDLVLIPGLLCTRALFAPQIEGLADIAEISVADHTRHDTMEELATSILADAPPRFLLCGLSLGGYIAFEMIRQAPERVRGLVLLDTNARADREEQKKQRAGVMDMARTEGLDALFDAFLPMMLHPDRLQDANLTGVIRQMVHDTGLEVYLRQQAAIMERRDNLPFLPDISCPTQVIVGAQDTLTPVKVAEEIATGIPGSVLDIIPDCGHLSTLEQPAAVNQILRKFIAQTSMSVS